MSDTDSSENWSGWKFSENPNHPDLFLFRCGEKEIHLERCGTEIRLAEGGDSDPENLGWSRWTTRDSDSEIAVQPKLPDLSILCEPATKFCIVPGAKSRVFIEIPLSVAVLAEPTLLTEYQTETLSHTWFGELETGELCYWISTQAQLTPPPKVPNNRAVAPVYIENQSDENLEVSRICLRTRGLNLFEKDGVLWTNETQLHYQGGSEASRVRVMSGSPVEAGNAKLITPAPAKSTSGIVARTFRSLLDWSAPPASGD